MTAATVIANNLEFNYLGDTPARLGERWWAMAIGQARDEITDEPLRSALTVTVNRAGILSKVGADGTFCLVARPWLRFPPLLAPSPQVNVKIEAPGYVPYRHTFAMSFDQRTIAAPPPVAGDSVFTLNSVSNLEPGDTLLLGPAGAGQEYVQVASINVGTKEVTIAGRLQHGHGFGVAVFPDKFTPAVADLYLRRLPVVVGGRVVRRNTALNTAVPLSGASIVITDCWQTQLAVRTHQPGTMTNVNPALRLFPLALAPEIIVERANGVTSVGSMPLPATPAMVKHIVEPVQAGGRSVTLSDRAGVAIGGLVQLDTDLERSEYQTIVSLPALGVLTDPTKIGIALPLVHDHLGGAPVERINTAPPPPATHAFKDGALPGDRTIFIDSLAGLAAQGTLRITDGAAPDEFHNFARYETKSDADGYFRLPPLHRVAQIHIRAASGPNIQDIDVQPHYGDAEHRVDIIFAV